MTCRVDGPRDVAERLVDALREGGERVTRVEGGWVTRCPACDEEDALFIRDAGSPDPDERQQ